MHDEGTNSRVKIFANIFISFIGAGILGLPYAFKEVSVAITRRRDVYVYEPPAKYATKLKHAIPSVAEGVRLRDVHVYLYMWCQRCVRVNIVTVVPSPLP